MSIAAILGAISAISTIVGGVVYMWKQGVWIFAKSTDQKEQAVATKVEDEQHSVEAGGRPQW